jgi:hypothetical protein
MLVSKLENKNRFHAENEDKTDLYAIKTAYGVDMRIYEGRNGNTFTNASKTTLSYEDAKALYDWLGKQLATTEKCD